MDMDTQIEYEDTLEPLGIAVGAILVLMGLGTVLGMPWQTNPNGLAVAGQLLGVLLMMALGAVLIKLSYTGDRLDAVDERLEF